MSDDELFAREIARYRAEEAQWVAAMGACREAAASSAPGHPASECRLVGPEPLHPKFTSAWTDVGGPTGTAAAGVVDVELLAQRAVARLRLPAVSPKVGPPPEVNPWGIAVVGYPLWLWTSGPQTVSTSASLEGVTLTLTARRVKTTFDMGEPGSRPVVCTATTAWTKAVAPAATSPTCGFTYQRASITQAAPDGAYTVAATEQWVVTWSALGQAGEIALENTGSIRLTVGEVQTVRRP